MNRCLVFINPLSLQPVPPPVFNQVTLDMNWLYSDGATLSVTGAAQTQFAYDADSDTVNDAVAAAVRANVLLSFGITVGPHELVILQPIDLRRA